MQGVSGSDKKRGIREAKSEEGKERTVGEEAEDRSGITKEVHEDLKTS